MYTFYIVPMMCPDGVVMGHIRVNSVGANLNREWAPRGTKDDPDFYEAPTLQRSPEVWYVLNKMDETGVDIALDIHGDEELVRPGNNDHAAALSKCILTFHFRSIQPYNFIAGGNGVSNWSKRLESLLGAFLGSYCRANPDMQKETGYAPDPPGEADMGCALNALTERFDCLAMTLEMPFKDCRSDPDPVHGWSPHRSYMLGASLVDPLAYIHPYLRDEGEFWTKLPADDAYVVPEGPPLTLPTN
jgi:murein tripeptide amidase MpaA